MYSLKYTRYIKSGKYYGVRRLKATSLPTLGRYLTYLKEGKLFNKTGQALGTEFSGQVEV